MTEDDTFNALKRTPRRELENRIVTDFYIKHMHLNYDDYSIAKHNWLKSHGWTKEEWETTHDRR